MSLDSKGRSLEGCKNYRMNLPANIPARDFWSVIVYDSLTHLIIHTDQLWPSVFSKCKSLIINEDGSVTTNFGPEILAGDARNWIKTVPGREWIMILRLYGPLEEWFNKTWRPGEIEEMKE